MALCRDLDDDGRVTFKMQAHSKCGRCSSRVPIVFDLVAVSSFDDNLVEIIAALTNLSLRTRERTRPRRLLSSM